MDTLLTELKTFLQLQIKTYQKQNHIEITFGRDLGDGIFKTIYCDNNDIEIAKLIKPFRNYKLSYSQGKIYHNQDTVLKTFNNKYNQIQKHTNLETLNIKFTKYDLQVRNIAKENQDEFTLHKDYLQDEEYDEVNIHLNPESHDQLLIFQKKGDYHHLKIELLLELNLPYNYLDELMLSIKKILETLQENGLEII